MKKFLSLIMVLLLAFSMTACGNKKEQTTSNNTDAETMLTSQTNIDTNLSGLGKASVFMNTMSSFDTKEAGSIVSSLIDAKSEG